MYIVNAMKSNDPNRDAGRGSNVPVTARNFTTEELQAVIHRAVELQAGTSARAEDGLSDSEVVKIGQELGLDPATVRRAMAEVRVRAPVETGAIIRVVGAGNAHASRVLRRPAASTGLLVEQYLRETERMVAQRRFPDRTRYIKDSSLAAGLSRLAKSFSRSHPALNLEQLDVGVSAIDADSCLVEMSVDLAVMRGGLVAGVLGSGTVAAGSWVVAVWASAIATPMMLLGLPVVAGSWFGTRAIYGSIHRSTQDKLESLLDRLEHNELV